MIRSLRLIALSTLSLLHLACGPTCRDGEDKSVDLDGNGVADCAETLLTNSQFVGSSIEGWAAGMEATAAANAEDARAFAGSGSMQVTNIAVSNSPTIRAARQCVPLTPEAGYVLAGQYHIAVAQPVSGVGAQIQLRMFSEPNCAGGELSAQVTSIDMMTATWGTLKANVNAPRANSGYFEASTRQNAGDGGAAVRFDNLLIHKL